jgi:phosphate transport system permease protein
VAIALKSTGPRQLKNTLAQWLITLGGISVLFTLVLIFLYLLYVIQPIFESAKIEPVGQFEISTTAPTLATGVDELKEIAFQINQEGLINFYQLVKSPAHDKGTLVLSENLLSGEATLVDVIRSGVENKLLLDSEGNVQLIAA